MGLAVASAGLAVVTGGWISVAGSGGRAGALLAAVEAAANLPVREAGPVERDGPDGPMPEIAGRRLVIAADAARVIAGVRRACATLGIAPADARRRAIEPQALCDGGPGHDGESVHLSLRCRAVKDGAVKDGETCVAYLQTQMVGS